MTYILKTARLGMREMTLTDAQAMFDLNSDPVVICYTGDRAFENLAEAENIIRYVQKQYASAGFGRWIVERLDDGAVIGWCGLKYHPDEDLVDIGYRFYQKYWGQGFGTEAAAACFEYGKNTLNLTRMIGNAVKENTASVQILEKMGFRYRGDKYTDGLNFGVYEWLAN